MEIEPGDVGKSRVGVQGVLVPCRWRARAKPEIVTSFGRWSTIAFCQIRRPCRANDIVRKNKRVRADPTKRNMTRTPGTPCRALPTTGVDGVVAEVERRGGAALDSRLDLDTDVALGVTAVTTQVITHSAGQHEYGMAAMQQAPEPGSPHGGGPAIAPSIVIARSH